MTKTLAEELTEELWLLRERDMIEPVKIRMNHYIYMQLLADHNSSFNMRLHKDDPRITFRGIPLEQTKDVEKWEIVIE